MVAAIWDRSPVQHTNELLVAVSGERGAAGDEGHRHQSGRPDTSGAQSSLPQGGLVAIGAMLTSTGTVV